MQTTEHSPSARLLRVLFPVFLALLVWALSPLTRDAAAPIKILITHWAAFVLGAVALFGSWIERRPFQRPMLVFWPIAGVLVLYAVAAALSDYWGNSFQYVMNWGALFLVYLAAAHAYRTTAQIQTGVLALCAIVAAASLYGFAQRLGWDPFPWAEHGMEIYALLPATFGNPNFAAHVLLLTIILALYLVTTRYRIPAAVLLTVIAVHLFMTQQRASVLALGAAAALFVSAWIAGRVTKRPLAATSVALTLTLVMGAGALFAGLAWNHHRTGQWHPVDGSLLLRYNSYFGAAQMILDRPITGFGPGNYEIENPPYWTDYEQHWYATERMYNRNVHNDFLEMGVDAGLPAAGLYLAMLLFATGYGLHLAYTNPGDKHRRRLGYAMAAFFTAFAVDSFFGFNLRVPVSAGLLFVALGWLEGVYLGPHPPRREARAGAAPLTWRTAAVAAAIGVALFTTRAHLGEVAMQRGRGAVYWEAHEEAIALFARAEALRPWDWRPSRERGLAHLRLRAPEPALTALAAAERKHPNDLATLIPLAHNSLAFGAAMQPGEHPELTMARVGRVEDAGRLARRGLDICEPLHELHGIMSNVLAFQAAHVAPEDGAAPPEELWAGVETHARKAVRYGAPARDDMYRLKARARMALGRPVDAEQAVVRGIRENPSNTQLWETLVELAEQHGRFRALEETARDHLGAGLPPTLKAELHQMVALAIHRRDDGDPAEAVEHLIEVCRIAPTAAGTWQVLAQLARETGQPEAFARGVEAAQQAIEAGGETPPPTLALIGRAFEAQGRAFAEETLRLQQLAMTVQTQGAAPAPHVRWAADVLVSELGRRGLGGEELGAALVNLAQVYLLCEAHGESQQLLASAMPLIEGPARQTALAIQTELYLAQGQNDAALNTLRQGIKEFPMEMQFRVGYARILAQTGQEEEARAQFEALLDWPGLGPQQRALLEEQLEALNQ